MLIGLDHVIIGVNDLARAETAFSQNLGLAVSGGGVHPSGGTAKRIIVIGDTYLELIAVRAPEEAQQSILFVTPTVLPPTPRPKPTLTP